MVKSYISGVLPEEFRNRHALMLYLYDILVDLLKKADKYGLSSVRCEFTNPIDENTDPFDELERMKDIEISSELYLNYILFSLLTDLNYFLYESLSCIERGKVTVAFSLARKPFLDNLFYLCWLLVDQDEFMEKFLYHESKKYDISNMKKNSNKVEEVFLKVQDEVLKDKYLSLNFSSEIFSMYQILFDKQAPNGINGIFNKSMHLVTGDRNYKTQNQNLNYIFFNEENWNEYWELYYVRVPNIILFIVEVAITLFEKFSNIPENYSIYNSFLRESKFIASIKEDKSKEELSVYFDIIFNSDVLTMNCELCNKEYDLESDYFKNEISNDFLISCQYCNHVVRLGQYFINNTILERKKVVKIDNQDNFKWHLKEVIWE